MVRTKDSNPWLEERREEYMRDMIENFFYCKSIFDQQWKKFQKEGKVDWEVLATFIGTAEEKGDLWQLKDLTHSLLDRPTEKLTYEFAFERCIHLLFHDLMSFKEHVYVLYQYKDILAKRPSSKDKELTIALKNFEEMILTMEKEIPREMELARKLFDIATSLLRAILPRLKENILIVKFIIEEKRTLEKHYGKGVVEEMLKEMFDGKPEEGYKALSGWYKKRGREALATKFERQAKKSSS